MHAKPNLSILSKAAAILSIGLFLALGSVTASAEDDAGAFVTGLNEQAVAQLNDPSTSDEQKIDRFLTMVNEAFDVEKISKFVLGAHWRKASKAERAEFIDVFSKVNFQRFLPLFTQYADQTFSVTKVRPDNKNPRLFFVSSSVTRGEGAPAQVDWRVIKSKDGGRYRIIDVKAEGVSMALTLRNEYGSVARNIGVGGLIAQLRDKASIDPSLLRQPASAQ